MVLSELKWKMMLIIISCFFVFGCSREPVIARVNGEAITEKDIKSLLKHAGIKDDAKMQRGGDIHKKIMEEILNQIINVKLVLQAARKENIQVDRKELMKAYNDIIAAFPREEDYIKKLKEKGVSKDMVLKSIENDLIVRKFKNSLAKDVAVSDLEVRGYYDKNLKIFTSIERVRLSVIRLSSIDEARRIRKEIERGSNFEEIAVKYPAGHTGHGESQTGWVTLDTFPAAMAKEIGKIKAGEFGGPIKGREGYYLIKVQEKMEKKVQPLSEVEQNIRHVLMQEKEKEKFNAWLQVAKGKAKIEILKKD